MKRRDLRTFALERANYTCEFPTCRWTGDLEMAHLKGSGAGGSRYRDHEDNVIMLCKEHHGWLDGTPIPNMRRFDNEMVLREATDRWWEERR
jgi:predicted restriction endonuclease